MRDFLFIERATTELQGRKHSVELQSLRGLASLAVVLHHCCFYYEYNAKLKHLSEVLINAHAAVVTFFVLSGFVLTLSLSRRPFSFGTLIGFYLRRAFRIYPALWVSLLLAIAYAFTFRGMVKPETVSAWWNPHVRMIPSLFVALLSIGGIFTFLAVPIWSLFVELVGSAVMPAFVWLLLKRTRFFIVVTLLLAVASQLRTFSIVIAPVYLVDFALGTSIVLIAPAIRPFVRRRSVALAVAGAALLALAFGRNLVSQDFLIDYDNGTAALCEAVASTVMIAVIYVRADLFGILKAAPLAWLGDISYSLYLIHLPILGFVAGLGGEVLFLQPFVDGGLAATAALALCTLVLSVAGAALCYRFIEVPAIRLGQAMVRCLPSGIQANPWRVPFS